VHRRWRYVTVNAATEETAKELATRLRDELSDGSAVSVNAEPPDPVFVLLGSRF
jgi:hypothetical protein